MINMRLNRQAVLISENEELYKSLRRALYAVGNLEVSKRGYTQDKNGVLIYVDNNKENLEKWICEKFRSRYLNPVITLGIEIKEDFEARLPLFKDRPYSHSYLSIPFTLKKLIDQIGKVKPIYDSVTRKIMHEDYCKLYEYKLITHDLKILSGDKEKTIKNFYTARDFYRRKGDKNTVKFIAGAVEKIKEKNDWERVAQDAKKILESKFE